MSSDLSGSGFVSSPSCYPYGVPIDSYGSGGFRFGGMSHLGSILCLPSGIYGCDATTITDLDKTTLSPLFSESSPLDFVLLGVGSVIVSVPESLVSLFSSIDLRYEVMSTGSACRTFNVLLSEGRSIGAILLAVD